MRGKADGALRQKYVPNAPSAMRCLDLRQTARQKCQVAAQPKARRPFANPNGHLPTALNPEPLPASACFQAVHNLRLQVYIYDDASSVCITFDAASCIEAAV